jgi:16S rRNA (guanine527-N7)-methyltransferase
VLDIGSGGGFPGIPLKIIQPLLTVTLLDSVGKKVKAMNHFVQEL